MQEQNNATHSLAHTKWNCKYHIVFAPKYRRQVFYGEHREAIREILRTLCRWKGVEIIEGEICPDHVHLLISIPPKMSVSGFVGYLKGKSSLMIFQRFGNMKFAYRNREFLCKGYYVDTTGKNTTAIKNYIANFIDKYIFNFVGADQCVRPPNRSFLLKRFINRKTMVFCQREHTRVLPYVVKENYILISTKIQQPF